MKLFKLIIAGSLFMHSGCSEDVNSDEVPTEVIWAGIVVEAKSNTSAKVNVELNRRTFDGDNLVLVGSDRLTASAQGMTKEMDPNDEFLDFDYETRFNVNLSDELIRIALARPSTNTSAPNSTVRMPVSFNLLQPFSGSAYNSDDIVVTNWSNMRTGAEVSIAYLMQCASLSGGTLTSSQSVAHEDDGYYEFSLSSHAVFSNAELDRTKPCELNVTLRRTISGDLDPVYRSGRITASQIRVIEDLPVQIVQ